MVSSSIVHSSHVRPKMRSCLSIVLTLVTKIFDHCVYFPYVQSWDCRTELHRNHIQYPNHLRWQFKKYPCCQTGLSIIVYLYGFQYYTTTVTVISIIVRWLFSRFGEKTIISVIVSWEWVEIAIILPGHYNRNYCEMKSRLFIKSR